MAETKENFVERKKQTQKVLTDHPNYALLELRKWEKSTLTCFDKKNLLAPLSYPFYLIQEDIRQRIGNVEKQQAIFCFINKNTIARSDMTIGELYNKYKSPDGVLYIEFAELDVYG